MIRLAFALYTDVTPSVDNYKRKDITALLIETYGSKVRIFENSISMSIRAAETSTEGVSIYQHDPKGRVAGAYHF